MNPFSENLNYIVRRHSDNISTIAQKAGLSRPSLYDLINGKTLPKNQTFNRENKVLQIRTTNIPI